MMRRTSSCSLRRLRLRAVPLLLALCGLPPAESTAQNRSSASGEFRTGGTFYENFFQAAGDGSRHDVWVGLLEIRLEDPLASEGRVRAYTRIELLQFRHIGSSPGVRVGLRQRGQSHSFDVSGGAQWNRPRSDVGDELEKADLVRGAASYTYRLIGGLHLTAEAAYQEEFLKPQRVTGSRVHELGGSVGYRAFGGRLSPDVGFVQGTRNTTNTRDAYVQETAYVTIRTTVVPRVSVATGYRQRRREYITREITSKNFLRQDRRQHLSINLETALGSNVIWNVSGSFEDGESTRIGRAFSARSLGTGFTVRY